MEHDTEMGRLTNKIIENSPVQNKGYILWDDETKGIFAAILAFWFGSRAIDKARKV